MSFAPSQVTTNSGLAHPNIIFYERVGLDQLRKKFQFGRPLDRRQLPQKNGKTIQFYRYNTFGSVTTTGVEGFVSSGQVMQSRIFTASISQYDAFVTFSDLIKMTDMSDQVAQASMELGYQAGLSVDVITRGVIDAETGASMSTLGATFTNRDLANLRAQLAGIDVPPLEDGCYTVIMHPFTTFDFLNDPTVGGFMDLTKYKDGTQAQYQKLDDRGMIGISNTCKVFESTNVYSSGSPSYRVYGFGLGAVTYVELEGAGPSNVTDPTKERFKVNVVPAAGPTPYDPAGVYGGAVSYKFYFTVAIPSGPNGIGGVYRYRYMDATSTVG